MAGFDLLRSRSILGTSVGMQAGYHCDWAIVGQMDTAKITVPSLGISPPHEELPVLTLDRIEP